MIKILRNTCKQLLNNSKDPEEKRKYELILKILADEHCFHKINIEDSYNILEDLKIPKDKIETTYTSIVSNSLKKVLDNNNK